MATKEEHASSPHMRPQPKHGHLTPPHTAADTRRLPDSSPSHTYSRPEPEPQEQQPQQEGQVEKDPYAGTNIDASQLGQMQEQALQGQETTPQENPATTRNKPSMSVGPDKRMTGLPEDAGNQNVDKRTERRVG